MKLTRTVHGTRRAQRRGAALLLSLLVLLVLVAIVIQISVSTATDARVARNDIGITTMDNAAESCLLDVYDRLKVDGESGGGGAADAAGGAAAAAPAGEGASPGPGTGDPGAAAGPTDSRRDEWAMPRREEINEIRMRILVQDENSKINVLAMLSPSEEDAQAAFDRVVRCLDYCRDGTDADIDAHTAEAMAKAMLEFMKQRTTSKVPRSELLSDDEKNEDAYLPLSLKEFAVLPPFDESYFRDFRDENGVPVHSIGSFLTVWSSLTTLGSASQASAQPGTSPTVQPPPPVSGAPPGSEESSGAPSRNQNGSSSGQSGDGAPSGETGATAGAPGAAATPGGQGAPGAAESTGYSVNVNTAPPAVLKALFDDRVVPPRFWDRVVEYRNYEEEKKDDEEESDVAPAVDEFGEEIIQRKIFDSLGELSEVDGFSELDPDVQRQINELLTTQSHVFSIHVVAHRTTSSEGETDELAHGRRGRDAESDHADALVRVIRSVVWRRDVGGEVEMVPIVRWEVLDYIPMEVLDYPDEDR